MDIHLALLQLGLNTSRYRLSQSPRRTPSLNGLALVRSQLTLNCRPLMMNGWQPTQSPIPDHV